MSRIRGKDTKPEIRMRSMLHRSGYRFRLHHPKLPGRPDLVFPKYHAVVFVHGCYWHRHKGCKNATMPKSRSDFWQAKFDGTIDRDSRNSAELTKMGWRVITVWECELEKDPQSVLQNVSHKLEGMHDGP